MIEATIQMNNDTRRHITALNSQVLKALEECGMVAEGYAKLNAPVNTGALRNSITHKVVEENGTPVCYIGSNISYAPFVEFGTGIYYDKGGRRTSWTYQDSNGEWHMTNGQRAKPYLKPAINEHMADYRKIVEKELKG